MHWHALRAVLIVGLVVGITVPATGQVAADEHLDQFGELDLVEMIFYPFVPHGETLDGTGPYYGEITIQNVDQREQDVIILALNDARFDPENALGTYALPAGGAITLSSDELGVQEPGQPVVIAAVYRSVWEANDDSLNDAVNDVCGGVVYTCKPSIAGVLTQHAVGADPTERTSIDGYNAIPAQDIAWGSQSRFCAQLWGGWPDVCNGVGTYDPLGYGLGWIFDGHSYLPIAQTNSGWNTVLHISNVDPSVWSGQVNVTLIESGQQGYAASAEHKITFERNLRPGQAWILDLKKMSIPSDWVGSVHITSNVGVVASASRVKAESGMLMTNVGAPSTWASTSTGADAQSYSDQAFDYQAIGSEGWEMYAPLVFVGYNGWNTGISIANIDEGMNTVTVAYYGSEGNVIGQDRVRIPPQSQEYVYLPASRDLGIKRGFVGSVVLSAPYPFHATIDQVKYETGDALSYMATAAGASPEPVHPDWPASTTLAMPLIQKGYSGTTGAASGLQLFNASNGGPVEVEIEFMSHTGAAISPTNPAPIRVEIPPAGSYTLHTPNLSEMAPNTLGTARVRVVGGPGEIVGVSNHVDYEVDGDGSTGFNLVNTLGQYRFPGSQTQ